MRHPNNSGFTLIELLVVIAIIAILSAILMPALSTATDRSRVTQCRSNLTHIGIALRMYYTDQGAWPPRPWALYDGQFITDPSMLSCTKTGRPYVYITPDYTTPIDHVVASCCTPSTPEGERPHSYGQSFVALKRGGEVVEMSGAGP